MEAITAVSTALITLYDMLKSVDPGMSIRQVLLEKDGVAMAAEALNPMAVKPSTRRSTPTDPGCTESQPNPADTSHFRGGASPRRSRQGDCRRCPCSGRCAWVSRVDHGRVCLGPRLPTQRRRQLDGGRALGACCSLPANVASRRSDPDPHGGAASARSCMGSSQELVANQNSTIRLIREASSNPWIRPADEECSQGSLLLAPGERLGVADIGRASSCRDLPRERASTTSDRRSGHGR